MDGLSKTKTGWTLFYHDPNNESYVVESYIPLITFHTVEELGAVIKLMKPKHVLNGMFFLMREGIEPIWESIDNRNGGAWSIRVFADNVYNVFMDIMMRTVGETLCRDPVDITGITLSPKRGACIIKIWTRDSSIQDVTLITDHPGIIKNQIRYNIHKEGKGFDSPGLAASPMSSPGSSVGGFH